MIKKFFEFIIGVIGKVVIIIIIIFAIIGIDHYLFAPFGWYTFKILPWYIKISVLIATILLAKRILKVIFDFIKFILGNIFKK